MSETVWTPKSVSKSGCATVNPPEQAGNNIAYKLEMSAFQMVSQYQQNPANTLSTSSKCPQSR